MSPGLAPARSVLANGLVLLAKRTRTTPSVTINIAIRAGSVCDPADAPGAMYLLSKVIDRGTATRSADDIAEALDSRGISLGVTVTRHLFSFICTCLAEDFAEVMALLADIVQHAVRCRTRSSRRARAKSSRCSVRTRTTPAFARQKH